MWGEDMRQPIIAGNWKMYKTQNQARDFLEKMRQHTFGQTAEVVILAPFTSLALFSLVTDKRIKYGAQDLFWEKEGPFTGEISPSMLVDLGCTFVLAGHSERRQIMGETDQMVNKKLKAALDSGLRPILCVGETLEQRERGEAASVVAEQLRLDLAGIDFSQDLCLAYEPIWAIGTGRNATPQDAQEMIGFIREQLAACYGREKAAVTRILYGGSVKSGNIEGFMEQADIDGALVGGSSLEPEEFLKIIKCAVGVNT